MREGPVFFTKALRFLAPLVILALGVGSMFLPGKNDSKKENKPPKETVAIVETATVQPHVEGLDIELDGLVEPFREINVSAEVAGKISFKAEICRAGNFVKQGTELIKIDSRDYELEATRLTKLLHQANFNITELEVEISNTADLIELANEDLQLKVKELRRTEKLADDDFASQTELDNSKARELASRNNLVSLKSQLRLFTTRRNRLESGRDLAQTQLDKANLDLERTSIKAATDGVIVSASVEQGSYVQKGAALFMLEDTTAAEVKCNLRMEDLYWLWNQQSGERSAEPREPSSASYQIPPAQVSIVYRMAGRKESVYRWQGVLSRFDGAGLDPQTRTVPCRISVDKPQQTLEDQAVGGPPALLRGMFVRVIIHTQPQAKLLTIPESGLRPGKQVWIMRQGQLRMIKNVQALHLIFTPAQSEADKPKRFWIIEAKKNKLVAGDKVIISPLPYPREGLDVQEKVAISAKTPSLKKTAGQ